MVLLPTSTRSLPVLIQEYYDVEKLFAQANVRDEDVILRLRDENKDDITKVVSIILSHSRVGAKNNLILAILNEYQPSKANPALHL